MHALNKYLQQWTARECQSLEQMPGHWQQTLVIPAYRETAALLNSKLAALHSGRTLVILVLNRPDSDPDTNWAQTLTQELGRPYWQSDHLSLHSLTELADTLLVDRAISGPTLAKKEGVGGARKIGADIACQLIACGRIDSPWIYNTDADATLPPDYFAACGDSEADTAACVYPFKHHFDDPDLPRWPTLIYEFQLHHYVSGLRRANSPYAWHTVGSTIAVQHGYYAAARGFPRRSGGEDFYLLNKLAKLGRIRSLSNPVISLQARHSDRVPFGTGPATEKLSQLRHPLEARSYHPGSFDYLRQVLQLLDQAVDNPALLHPAHLERLAEKKGLPLLLPLVQYSELASRLADCRRPGSTPVWRRQQLMQGFDGFKSLKALHWLRDQGLADVPLKQLMAAHSSSGAENGDKHSQLEERLIQINRQQRIQLADGGYRGKPQR